MKLYIVATPIGNLDDITRRAVKVLERADIILGEDTRVTKKLLSRLGISGPVFSFHQHSKLRKTRGIINNLRKGKSIALTVDSGSPGISDPGGKLIAKVIEELPGVEIIPIPGASATIAAASISGFSMDSFLFLGFSPKKRKRKKFFTKVVESSYPVIFYESPHRIIKTLEDLKGFGLERNLVVCREMTKIYESFYRGKIEEVLGKIKEDKIKGEFTIVIEGK